EHISGLRLIRSYGIETLAEESFAKDAEAASDANLAVASAEAKYEPVIIITMGASFLLAVGGGGWLIQMGEFTVGELTRFTLYLGQLIWPMFAYGWLLNLLKRGTVSYQRIQEVLEAPAGMEDNGKKPLSASADIHWNISVYRYPETDYDALLGFSGQLLPKHVLGVVGPTGAGKSTFLQLLLRQYESPSVTVQLDGLALQDYPLESVHQHFAVVPQEPFLFSSTVAENIRLGKPSASDEDIRKAAEMAVIHDDIMRLPKGYNTEVGERGVTLSGGQKQRLSIARALLRDAPVLVLDDALSAVDVATERRILHQLKKQRGDRAMIIVCHRLTAVENADETVVLRQGQAVERGSHQQLMANNGWYADAYRYQQLEQAVVEGH
ncbi:MAG: ATP-binding cassette domain-containing protein, partial [Gammaproteobacteria bacterium]|nr:ATP-binding cassette domain-containing protein [Gammaproteobacteria bacterium]